MSFITFIYRMPNNQKIFFGKYCFNYISKNHDGLDKEAKSYLVDGINQYRRNRYMDCRPDVHPSDISLGVISFCNDKNILTHSSKNEIKCFDFYCEHRDTTKNSIKYINGKLV